MPVKLALRDLANAKQTLRNLNIIRSERLTGEIGEYIASIQLPCAEHAATTSNKGWDLLWKDPASGNQMRIQVKCHAKGPKNTARWTVIKHLDDFEILMIVVLSHDYQLKELYQILVKDVQDRTENNLDRKEFTVYWDKFKDFKIDPNEKVKAIFEKVTTDAEELVLDDEEVDMKWKIITAPNAANVYFVPQLWHQWNHTGDNQPNNLKGKRFVFELYPRENSNGYVLILRGQILKESLEFPKNDFNQPANAGKKIYTKGYAIWKDYEEATMPTVKTADGRPYYPTDDDLLNWISRWEEMVAKQLESKEAFWHWIEKVNEWGNSNFLPEGNSNLDQNA